TGIDDATLARKTAVIEAALGRYGVVGGDALAMLAAVGGLAHAAPGGAAVGGLERAALAVFALGGAARRVPVILDGVIACAAALVAVRLAPDAVGALVAGHRSAEPGASGALAD